ncbi:hypothetical protein [Sphingomonas jatrophae]|uniref:Uncharacterized protein n=1 Tax=Sphingomonas jatrophae TaxID=1166337 RepID=A0A1I6KXN7_9SPHN|nr:hypothetical protein [Sphingomonas jatrophae]SFR95989.1 hypothetical protein SAMN05192580_1898 [Sphingomonas jatrophae]
MLRITDRQFDAVAVVPREAAIEEIAGRLNARAQAERRAPIPVDQVRAWVNEAMHFGVDDSLDVSDLCTLFAEMHWAGGRPPFVAERLAEAGAEGRLKVFQIRMEWQHGPARSA